MPAAHKPVTITPKDGGKLATDVSANEVGLPNYRIKRDWRRYIDRELRREGYVPFAPTTPTDAGPFNGPITLIHKAKAPNGAISVIVGTPTTIYRYYSQPDFYALGDSNGPYFQAGYIESPTEGWKVIGDGFTPTANRWEVDDLGPDMRFNNGVDLPVVYSLSEFEVTPLYELRENEIIALGTNWQFNSVAMAADVSQIKGSTNALAAVMQPIEQPGTAKEVGTISSGATLGFIVSGGSTVNVGLLYNASLGFVFDGTMVGKTIRFFNGWTSVIQTFNSSTVITLATPAPFQMQLPFEVLAGATDSYVTATNSVFTSNMVGLSIFWDSGFSRKIVAYVNATTVQVDTDQPVSAGTFSIENPLDYGTVTDTTLMDRRGYRVMWSALNLARRYSATVNCTIDAGSNVLTFAYPVRSFYNGQKIVITGAGVSGSDLTANILYMQTGGLTAVLDTTAATTVLLTDTLDSFGNLIAAAGQVSAWDMIGSIVGFDDLEEDGSRIIRAMELNGGLVLYRETGYQLGTYTGDPTAPFNFPEMVQTSNTLYYKYTLARVTFKGYDIHMFAGRNSFFRFDGISRAPIETLTSASYTWQQGGAGGDINLCRRTFYQQAAQGPAITINSVVYQRSNFIFSADNEMTREVFVCFPSTSQDQALCFDYENGTVSTTSAAYTAGETIFNPVSTTGEKWFVLGTSAGLLLQYGKADTIQSGWTVLTYPDGTQYSAIFSRSGQPYESRIKSGMGSFNQNLNEKHVDAYSVELSSFSADTPVTANIYASTNPNAPVTDPEHRGETLLGSAVLTASNNLFPTHFQQYYFSDEIVVNGINNPCELVARVYNLQVVRTVGVTKASGG